jgi:putative DNA primase/helicase
MPKPVKSTRLPLTPADLADLRSSGLTDKTILANRLRSSDTALEFIYRDLHGIENCYKRRKPHTPRVDAKRGRVIKYEAPKDEPPRPYFPAECVNEIREGDGPLLVVEGEKKGLATAQAGFTAIALSGVWNYKPTGHERLIDGLAAVPWVGRDVFILFDFDAKPETRRQIDAARRRLATLLLAAGAKGVFNVELPPGPDGAKQGADDFLVAEGPDGPQKLKQLIADAKPILAVAPSPMRVPAGRTDAANSSKLAELFGDQLRWVGPWDKFLLWDGKRWKIDNELRVDGLAKQVGKERWLELAREMAEGGLDRETSSAMYAFAKSSNNANGLRAMVSLARSEQGIAVPVEQLDSDPWLLNVQNGTLDLRTGKMREHSRDDYITKIAPVRFDRTARCPTWLSFLSVIFRGNAELIGYVQRLIGYSMTGSTAEHVLPFAYGPGAGGKSTLCEATAKLLGGDYAMKAPPDLLMAKRGESHPTERADLWGKRFVACIETEAGRRLAEALVKELTGGDRVRARRMREDFWEFAPTHHVWLVSNHKPAVLGTDHGIWRRIKLIPFDVIIPDHQQDKRLPEKLEAELPGILNWAIAGCLDWQRDGMREPEIVRSATKGYRDESDDIGRFIEHHCEIGAKYVVPATRLFEKFTEVTGSELSQRLFGSELTARGFVRTRMSAGPSKGLHGWRGLRLTESGGII